MITVHHLENSRSQRVLWLLEELKIPYEVKAYKRGPDMAAPPELRAVHPLGKSPVIEHDGRVIAETGAIIDYVMTHLNGGSLRPVDEAALRHFTYWMYYAEGSAMTPLLLKIICIQLPKRVPFFIRPVAKAIAAGIEKARVTDELERHYDLWEQTLSQSLYFAGDAFSAADIMMSFPVEAAAARAGAGERPAIRNWLNRIHARPAYKAALERGGPYAYA